ncbi:MAG: hypothetical protein LBQ24_06180 [Candidatus Peribacteria bacterium]|jgi:hypothetical protein|nr:hypothetical protein [Candidatus Peribacteria bacterium]
MSSINIFHFNKLYINYHSATPLQAPLIFPFGIVGVVGGTGCGVQGVAGLSGVGSGVASGVVSASEFHSQFSLW